MKNPAFKGRYFYIFGSFTSKLLARKKEAEHPGSFIHHSPNGRYYVLKRREKLNPSGTKRLAHVYGRVLSVHAQKVRPHKHCDAECKRVHHKYVHDFKRPVFQLGLPDGSSILLKDGTVIPVSDGTAILSDREY